jgi:hypothetical protein
METLMDFSLNDFFSICQKNSFGIFQLIQVYSKLSILIQSVQVSSCSKLLIEKEKKIFHKKNKKELENDLLALQPTCFFHLPQHFLPLIEWMCQMLKHLHLEVEKTKKSTRNSQSRTNCQNKKRQRHHETLNNDNTETLVNVETINTGKGKGKEVSLMEEKILCRFQNVFSFVLMLIQECIMLILQNRQLKATSEDMQLIGKVIDCLRIFVLDVFFDRSIFFQCSQLFSLLEQKQKDHSSSLNELNKSTLDTWHKELGIALENAYENNQEEAKDLWKRVEVEKK